MDASVGAIQKAFLRGYFDADGYLSFKKGRQDRSAEFKKIHHYYPQISLCSISKELIITDIEHMLESMGFCYNIYEVAPNGRGKNKKYLATINGATQLKLWMKEIVSSNPVHSSKYEVWKRFGFCPPRTTLEQRITILSGRLDPEIFY